MKYYLGPWQWQTLGAMPCFAPPSGAIGAIDLGTLPEMAAGGAARKGCLFWAADNQTLDSSYALLGTGDVRTIASSARVLSAFKSLVGYRPEGDWLSELILDCLIGGADVDGQSGPMPIFPGADGWVDLHMHGHGGKILGARFEWGKPTSRGHDLAPKIKQVLRKQFSSLLADAQAGKLKDAVQHLRVLDFWCEKFKVDDWKEFVPLALQKDVPGRIGHETTITDDFNRADGSTIGDQLTWAKVSGSWQTTSNQLEKSAAGSTMQFARAESDLSSSDHYAQAKVYGGDSVIGAGPACRMDSSLVTNYFVQCYSGANYISKMISGSQTNLTNAAHAFSTGETSKVQASGSTISHSVNGSALVSTTDTAITGNLRCGVAAYNQTAHAFFDDFQAADLSAVGTLYTQLERGVRGLVRGTFTRWD